MGFNEGRTVNASSTENRRLSNLMAELGVQRNTVHWESKSTLNVGIWKIDTKSVEVTKH